MKKNYLSEIKDCYNLTANEYSINFINELADKPFDRNILDRFSDMLPKNRLVYDFGCGSGQTTKYIFDKNKHKVIGLDFSDNTIALAKKNFPNIKFQIDDMLNSNMPSLSANGIIAFYAIVHFHYNDIKKVLKEWYRLLKSKGICLISFHIGEESVYIKNFLDVKGANATWYFLNTDKIIAIAENVGFKIVDTIIRYPYKGIEHESKRAYLILEK